MSVFLKLRRRGLKVFFGIVDDFSELEGVSCELSTVVEAFPESKILGVNFVRTQLRLGGARPFLAVVRD